MPKASINRRGNSWAPKSSEVMPPKYKAKGFTIVFILVLLADLLSMTYYPNMRLLFKPAIVGTLIAWYITVIKGQNQIFLIALIFAMLGDVFLFFSGDLFFKLGIAAFSVMQILYIYVFKHYYRRPTGGKLLLSILIPIIAISFMIAFGSALGNMLILVVVYAILISIMAYFAINKTQRFKQSKDFIIGGLSFMLSDFILAYDKFVMHHVEMKYAIMITYAIAQYFIVRGMIVDSKRS